MTKKIVDLSQSFALPPGVEATILAKKEAIKNLVRCSYGLQSLRIKTGNQLSASFRRRLGYEDPDVRSGNKELDAAALNILDILRHDYRRITDGIVDSGDELIDAKMPTERKFKPFGAIQTYADLLLVKNYLRILKDEDDAFKSIEKLLKGIPLYDNFMSKVKGLGVQMAAVLISEIDAEKTPYVESLYRYVGLDVVRVGEYTDEAGTVKHIGGEELEEYLCQIGVQYDDLDPKHPDGSPILWKGKYKITFKRVGRSRKEESLVTREYRKADGSMGTRRSITYNDFLKTKARGVLATSFLMGSRVLVNGQEVTSDAREKMADKLGFVHDKKNPLTLKDQVIDFLRNNDYEVRVRRTYYGKIYDDYKARITAMPAHASKTKAHIHNMASRYMMKRYFQDHYVAMRMSEGLPVMPPYHIAKLGLEHNLATEEKAAFYAARGWVPVFPEHAFVNPS